MSQINNVFLIDDSEAFNYMHLKTMERAHFAQQVKTFESGTSALALLRQLSISNPGEFPDMIFLDINMPGMNGWDFLDSIENFSISVLRNCKVFLLTSSIDQNDIDHAKTYEMVSDFISKPLTVERLQSIGAEEPHSTNKKN